MLLPRIGAICILLGFGFAAAQVGRLMAVTASEGYGSWATVAILLAPVALTGLATAILVLRRHPLGTFVAFPFCALLAVAAGLTFAGAPPVGGFLDDYERAALTRGVTVPPYLADTGMTPQEYVERETGDVRTQGAIGALALLLVVVATILRGARARVRDERARRARTGVAPGASS